MFGSATLMDKADPKMKPFWLPSLFESIVQSSTPQITLHRMLLLVCGTCDLLVDALVVVELDPEVLVDAALPHRVVILKVNVDYLQGRKNREND